MNDPSDEKLKSLIAGKLPPEEERDLTEAISNSEELQKRLDHLSGAAKFENEFDPDPAFGPDFGREESQYYLKLLKPTERPGFLGRLGDYEIEKVIAVGGMGVVFKGCDPGLDREVAIKLLSPLIASSVGARERFRREATAIAALDHGNIIPVYAIDESGELPFMVMRFVDGESLEQVIKREGAMVEDEIILIGKAMARALVEAHSKGLVHRDIKPSNILLEENGAPFLSDFGIALVERASGLTIDGRFLGTPSFTSPEQAEGRKVDHRADLFSLGSVLYAMVTGKAPFIGDGPAETIYQVVHQKHSPLEGAASERLSQIIDRLLEKRPDDRFQNAQEVVDAFEEEGASRPKVWWKNPRVLVPLFVLVSCLVLIPLMQQDFHSDEASKVVIRLEPGGPNFGSLSAAVEAAEPGGVIYLGEAEEIEVGAVVIPRGKPLTLRALDSGKMAKIRLGADDRIISESDLSLEGLHIEHSSPADSDPVLMVSGGRLSIARCRFDFRSDGATENSQRSESSTFAFVVSNPVEVTIVESEFYANAKHLIRVECSQASLRFENNVVVCPSFIAFTKGKDEAPAMRVTMKGNSFVNESTVAAFAGNEMFSMSFVVEENIFDTTSSVFRSAQALRVIRESVDWRGASNRYYCGGDLMQTRRGQGGMRELEMWNRIWKSPEVGSSQHFENPLSDRVRDAKGDLSKLGRKMLELPVNGE